MKKGDEPKQAKLSSDEIDQLVLTEYPYPIAANYRRMLEADSWQKKTRDCIKVFEYSIRAITLGVLSQYLIRDLDKFSDPELNRELFKKKLSEISLGTWVQYLFLTLKVYGGKRDIFFMQELYDLYWDITRTPHQPRKGVQPPFESLVQIRNNLEHKTEPKDEKGWENLGREALENLREVMRHFSFLQHYDLIRIVNPQGEEYEYEQYTGQTVTHHQKSMQSEEHIQSGWFYISRQDNTLLGLHPLLIFWTSKEGEDWIEGKETEEQDVAVFDRLMKGAAGYIATVMRDVFEKHDATLMSQLRDLIYYNLEHVKMSRQRVKLSWAAVWGAAQEVSTEQMETAQKKYNPVLYLQRDGVFEKFQEFLESDKGCFVLTGKSGVGKSNFILSLASVFTENERVGVLMYNAARLDTSLSGMVQKISQDLGKSIQMQGEALDLFAEIGKNEDMTGRQLIIIFDAINENADPRGILQKIDQMVGQARYPWLKIMVTSRPEGWRTMKRGLSLAEERYYREKGSQEVSVELEEFIVKLESFEHEELQSVYEKYQRFFNLQTEYATLKSAVRNALRDPLVLRLVAEVYKDRIIPDHIQVNDIYKLYIDNLLSTGRLHREDVILLEQELIPLMLTHNFYENNLTALQVQAVRTKDGRPLWELLHNTDVISSGQRVNDSYVRLRDTELLDESGSGLDYAISFKYERFYEFFGGRRLYQAAKESAKGSDFYSDVAEQLNVKIFLWGALVQSLVLELKDGNLSLLAVLAEKTTDNRLLRSALVEAMVRFGEGDKERERAGEYIVQLLGQLTLPPRNFFVELWRLLRPVREESLQGQPQKMIVVEAAARLGLTDLLEKLAVEPSPWLRNVAAQNIFYLWKRDRQAGIKVLEGLSSRVRGKHNLPDLGAAESMLALTGAILGVEHKDPATLESLLRIGRNALRRILYLTDLNQELTWATRIRKSFLGFVYNLITGAILKFVLRVMSEWGEHASASLQGFEHFFNLSAEQKQLIRSMIPFLDYDEPGFENRIEDIIKINDWGDLISRAIVDFPLVGRGVKDFDGTLAIAQKLMEYGVSYHPPSFWVAGGPFSNLLQSATHLDNPNSDLMKVIERVTKAIQEDPASWVKRAQQDRPVPVPSDTRASNLGVYLFANYIFTKRAEIPDLIQKYLDRALQDNDEEYILNYIQDLVPLFETGSYHRVVVAGLIPLVGYKNDRVRQEIINILVRIRNYDPDYIEDLLLRGDFPQEIADRVLANPTVERLTDLLTFQLYILICDLFLLGPKFLRNELKWLLIKALDFPNFEEFVSFVIREILNIVIGEVVFNVPADAPSRQFQATN